MCEVCENKTSTFGSILSDYTNLGDDVGGLYANGFLVLKKEDKEEIVPALGFEINYGEKQVYSFRRRIKFCPFCGRNLKGS